MAEQLNPEAVKERRNALFSFKQNWKDKYNVLII